MKKEDIWDPELAQSRREWFLHTIELIRSRYQLLTDFVNLGRAYFSDDYPIDKAALKKNVLNKEEVRKALPLLSKRLELLKDFQTEEIERVILETVDELEIKSGILINGIRTIVTGQAVGPGFSDALRAIGKDRVVKRLMNVKSLINGQ